MIDGDRIKEKLEETMTLSPRGHRNTKIRSLCEEIDSLVDYYSRIPTESVNFRETVAESIDRKVRAIDDLNQLHALEKPSAKWSMGILAAVLSLIGVVSHSYGLFIIGIGLGIFVFNVHTGSPEYSKSNVLTWSPPAREAYKDFLVSPHSGVHTCSCHCTGSHDLPISQIITLSPTSHHNRSM